MKPLVEVFPHPPSGTCTYLVVDEAARTGLVIDPVRDFDRASGRTSWRSAEQVATRAHELGIAIPYVLDTHPHEDHFTGLPFFKEHFGARTVIGARITEVQRCVRELFDLDLPVDGRPFDVLLGEGDRLEAGGLHLEALYTPGHTPACLTYRIGEALFVGDAVLMPDYGTSRCDCPGGSPGALFDSLQRLYRLGDDLLVFTCHDYRPGGRPLRYASTIREERRTNIQLRDDSQKADYVAFRHARDASLPLPELLLPAIQVNVRAGELPPPAANGIRYLKLPLDAL